jgi:hypothetical protein
MATEKANETPKKHTIIAMDKLVFTTRMDSVPQTAHADTMKQEEDHGNRK